MSEMTLPTRRPFDWRQFWILIGLMAVGIVGIVPYSLTLQSEALKTAALPMPLPLLAALQIVQGLITYGALAAVGLFLAGRIGLGLPILAGWLGGESMRGRIRRFLAPALAIGVFGSIAIILLDLFIFAPRVGALLDRAGIEIPGNIRPPAWQGFLASFYGGIVEEVLLRLFLLTLFVWFGGKFFHTAEGRPVLAVLWVANVLAAVLFGLGHLPATAAAGLPVDALIVTRAVVLNGLLGLGFGWLYWAHGLESAMLSHFSADIVLHVIVPLLPLK